MHTAHHVYKKDMSRPCAQSDRGKKDEKVKKKKKVITTAPWNQEYPSL